MEELVYFFKKIAPDLTPVVEERMDILAKIKKSQPIGRRLLAEQLNISERTLRNEITILRQNEFIESSYAGMTVTRKGVEAISFYDGLMHHIHTNHSFEERITQKLNITSATILAGDCSKQNDVLEKIGQRVVHILDEKLPLSKNIIAIMGGSSVASVTEFMTPQLSDNRELLFVPARGGIGGSNAIQANTICDKMARQTGGKSRVLYTPDQMSSETAATLLQEPSIKETLKVIKQANALLFGIGDAENMMERRDFDPELTQKLKKAKVVGEAFGEFFDEEGNVVYRIPRIGLRTENLADIPLVIAVAGGAVKGKAIQAYLKKAPTHIHLVTDEGAAQRIIEELA